jgi:transcriptional regulator with GAF, ATPase, and Fis domain
MVKAQGGAMDRGPTDREVNLGTEDLGTQPLSNPSLARLATRDSRFQHLLSRLPLYAATDLPVLITGEPGTGKELIAEALWDLSPRCKQPFYRINCANLSAELAGSELFGHLKGAFTGAEMTRPGKFKAAHRGTLFLDEVGDLPLAIQPRLLRSLEQGEIEPVGGDAPARVDVRLLTATNQDLSHLVATGRFRRDVFDRLAVLIIDLPPLRDRGDDLTLLARQFLQEEAGRYQRQIKDFSPAARRQLKDYSWPGNVRELRNVITRAVLFSSGPVVQDTDLYFASAVPGLLPTSLASREGQVIRPLRLELEELLREEGGNISALARRLKVCNRTVYRWLKHYDLDIGEIRAGALCAKSRKTKGAATCEQAVMEPQASACASSDLR